MCQPPLLKNDDRRLVCQDEDDRVLPNAKRNILDSKNNATRPNAGSSAKLKNHWGPRATRVNWIWMNCKGTPRSKPRCSGSEPTRPIFPAFPGNPDGETLSLNFLRSKAHSCIRNE